MVNIGFLADSFKKNIFSPRNPNRGLAAHRSRINPLNFLVKKRAEQFRKKILVGD